jgi:hypothetical protein
MANANRHSSRLRRALGALMYVDATTFGNDCEDAEVQGSSPSVRCGSDSAHPPCSFLEAILQGKLLHRRR